MFKFLKDKLKSALDKITKKVEEEALEEVIEEVVEQPKETASPTIEKPKKQKKEPKRKKEKKQKQEKITVEEYPEEKPQEPAPVVEEKKPSFEPVVPEAQPAEEQLPEQPKVKQGFFSRFFKKKEEVAEELLPEKQLEPRAEVKEEPKEEPAPIETIIEEKKGFFGKLKERIVTKKITAEKFEELFWELEVVMLENNVAVAVIDRIKTELKHRLVDKPLPRGQIEKIIQQSLRESIAKVLSVPTIDLLAAIKNKNEKPYVMVFFGINGAGKTTSIARVAHLLKSKGLRCVLVAADTFRAGAKEQIIEWGKRLNLKVISHDYGADPAAVCWDGIAYGKKDEADVVLIDTAGRQHSNVNLVEQMKKIVRVAKPDLKIFVGESITGNDAVEQCDQFNKSIGIDAIILTKADVDDKGGAMISVSYVTGKPILYLGVGQRLEDLEPFQPEKILQTMGL